MQIKRDPISRLWCRSDGAVLIPPTGIKFKKFHWTFGSTNSYGYKAIKSRGKNYYIHRIICCAFHGLPPEDKPEVDHINRIRHDNRPENLHWASSKENNDNQAKVYQALERYKVRACEDHNAYIRARYETHGKRYRKLHRDEYAARSRAYGARKRAKMKAQGLTMRKGPDGKYGWYPRIRAQAAGGTMMPNSENS